MFSALMGFAFLGVFWYTQSYATLHNALEQVTILSEERRRVHLQFRDVERDIIHLQRKLFDIDQGAMIDDGDDNNNVEGKDVSVNDLIESESYRRTSNQRDGRSGDLIKEMVALQERLSESNTQIGSLQHHLQETSRRDAERKYGSGVIRVQLELEFPEDYIDKAPGNGEDEQQQEQPTLRLQQSKNKEKKTKKPTKLIMEMASLELMPHSVNMFLDMVHAGLFDGCSFVLMAMQMIKLAPLPYDGSSASAKVRSFTKHGLETVAFKEYSPDFPHQKYTVAFSADGSPSFYINTEDNTELHVGEPCFAKIVSGFDTLQRLASEPTRGGIWYRRRVGLKHATIL
jgi:cyclophilin family peptidyl-prolyl cis-trans isomerase